jgi:SAM-dependent methyltransferase
MLRPLLKQINLLRCKSWDFVHGVKTCGETPITSLDFQSENKDPRLEYQSHHPRILYDMLATLKIEHRRFTFVDYGCGKGRVLLVAAAFPFHKIAGVEFAPQLAEIAQRNLKNYRCGARKCGDMKVFAMDATDFALAPEPLVLFFYSPFTGAVMEKVIANIEESCRQFPRELYVLFTGKETMREKAFGSLPQYRRLRRELYFDLYQRLP